MFDEYIIYDGEGYTGSHQRRFRFPNNYGASIIKGGDIAYGSWELAVVDYSDGQEHGSLTYDTPISDDVIGYIQSVEQENEILQAIFDLPVR